METAVEHRRVVVPEVAEQPPEAAGRVCALVVVNDDPRAALHTGGTHGPLEGCSFGQRMPAGVRAVTGHLTVEVDEDRSGDVAGVVGGPAGAAVQVLAEVDDAQIWVVAMLSQPGAGDQRAKGHCTMADQEVRPETRQRSGRAFRSHP